MRDEPMPLAYSLYLDLVRFTAAMVVFVGHLAKPGFTRADWSSGDPVLPVIHQFGAIAVTVFFVLSGYVIAYVVATRERDAFSYSVSRVSRLFSVVVPALVLTLAFDTVGSALDPTFYARETMFRKPPSLEGYAASLFLVNEFQVFDFGGIGPGSNGPYWSLSFEAAYYAAAGLILFVPRRVGLALAILLLAAGGKTIVALAPIWALGFWLFHARDRLNILLPAPRTAFILSLIALAAIPWLLPKHTGMNFGLHFPWGRGEFNRNLAADYAAALAVGVHLVAARKLFAVGKAPSQRVQGMLRWLGLQTFPLYAAHFPAMGFFFMLSPWPAASLANVLFATIGALLTIAALTPLCEWLKRVLRDGLHSLRRSPLHV